MALEVSCIVIISSEILIVHHKVENSQLKAVKCSMCSNIRLHQRNFASKFRVPFWRSNEVLHEFSSVEFFSLMD